ncbi:hypothetical protein DFS33DRAFT_1485555 [Desarmillaria ectypa]|nr:hypothetical protein DFS33DRAFT_1485555 [Desarmillaria ectypa]
MRFFSSGDDPQTFGFVDPSDDLRASHIMPTYIYGQTSDILSPSIYRRFNEDVMVWVRHYVDIFADRDVFMRYCGNGVSHGNTREYTRGLWEELLDGLGLVASENTSAAESDAEDTFTGNLELGAESREENSDAEIDSDVEHEDSDGSWHSDEYYVELNEPEEDGEFDDHGLFGYSAL